MPSFPECGLDITREQAFNMLLGSVAMEELALSHIMNAEGEKLQYVLGTLPNAAGSKPTTQELLEVNQSITTLLEHVAHNQFLLKGKLKQVLEAQEKWSPPPCPSPCHRWESNAYREKCEGVWCAGQRFIWRAVGGACHSRGCISAVTPSETEGTILVSFAFELLPTEQGQIAVALSWVGTAQPIVKTSAYAAEENAPVYLSGSTVVTPRQRACAVTPLEFTLCQPQKIWVKRAQLTITPLR